MGMKGLFYQVDPNKFNQFMEFCKKGVILPDGHYDTDHDPISGGYESGIVNWLQVSSNRHIPIDQFHFFASEAGDTLTNTNAVPSFVVMCLADAAPWSIPGLKKFLAAGDVRATPDVTTLLPRTDIDNLLVTREAAIRRLPADAKAKLMKALIGSPDLKPDSVKAEIFRDFNITIP
jgi:hypothetical protein